MTLTTSGIEYIFLDSEAMSLLNKTIIWMTENQRHKKRRPEDRLFRLIQKNYVVPGQEVGDSFALAVLAQVHAPVTPVVVSSAARVQMTVFPTT